MRSWLLIPLLLLSRSGSARTIHDDTRTIQDELVALVA